MTTITEHSKTQTHKSRRPNAAFTLAEVLVSMALAGLVIAVCVGSLTFVAKSSRAMGNYQVMNASSRSALDQFAADSRMTADVTAASGDSVSLQVYDADGGTSAVVYSYDAASGTFTRTEGGVTRVLLKDVSNLALTYYTLHSVGGETTTDLAEIKEMQLEATMVKQTMQVDNTNHIISARFMMRNKPVAI